MPLLCDDKEGNKNKHSRNQTIRINNEQLENHSKGCDNGRVKIGEVSNYALI